MTRQNVATDLVPDPEGALDVDRRAHVQAAQVRVVQGLPDKVEARIATCDVDRGQAASVHGNGTPDP